MPHRLLSDHLSSRRARGVCDETDGKAVISTFDTNDETDHHSDYQDVIDIESLQNTAEFIDLESPSNRDKVIVLGPPEKMEIIDAEEEIVRNGIDLNPVGSNQSSTEPATNSSNSEPPENEKENMSASEDADSLVFSEKHSEISWSDSDGSTYVSEEDSESALKVRPKKKEKSVSFNHIPEVYDEVCVEEEKHSKLEKPEECADMVEIDLEKDQEYSMAKETPKQTNVNQKKKLTLAEEAEELLKKFGQGALTPKAANGKGKLNPPISSLKSHPYVFGEYPYVLRDIEYYSDVEVASNSDDISEPKFLSKYETKDVFCQRLIPLEIPTSPKGADDVSVLSSVNDVSVVQSVVAGDNSEMAVHTRKGSSKKKTERRSRRKPQKSPSKPSRNEELESVDDENFTSSRHNADMLEMVLFVPSRPGSLSSIEALSDDEEEDPSTEEALLVGDEGSDDAVRPVPRQQEPRPRKTPSSPHKKKPRPSSSRQPKEGGSGDKKPKRVPENGGQPEVESGAESSTDKRIRELKERIKKMQSVSQFEQARGTNSDKGPAIPEDPKERKKYVESMIAERMAKARQETSSRPTKSSTKTMSSTTGQQQRGTKRERPQSDRSRQQKEDTAMDNNNTRKLRADMQEKLNSSGRSSIDGVDDAWLKEFGVSKEQAKHIFKHPHSKPSSSASVPVEVPLGAASDEVSAIHNPVLGYHQEPYYNGDDDEETPEDVLRPLSLSYHKGSSHNFECPEEKTPSQKALEKAKHYCHKAKEQTTALTHTSTTVVGSWRDRLVALWNKVMQGRTPKEQIVLCIIAVCTFILFLLVIAVAAK